MVIEIIGAVGGVCSYSSEDIAALLAQDHTQLSYGSQFMGRPGTQLYSSPTDIVKLRSELKLNAKRIREWVQYTLQQEQTLAVHHPKKSWFIVELSPGEYTAGNICPRLIPLHKLFMDNQACSQPQRLQLLDQVYQAYFYIASHYQKRLDEGLSNFGVDGDKFYYLDDDFYSWDNFLSFAHTLATLVRNNPWLDKQAALVLGKCLSQRVGEFFEESVKTNIIGLMRDIFMPNPSHGQLFNIIAEQLQQRHTISKTLKLSNRYWAIFSDIHANLPALEAVLGFLRQENITQGLVMGDIVGYGPDPVACIERLQDYRFAIVKGNHDQAAASGDIHRGMSSTASWCIAWTLPLLAKAHKDWLASLPLEFSGTTDTGKLWIAVHGSPRDAQYIYGYVYEMTYAENLDVLQQRDLSICFHGHTHVQGVYARKKNAADAFYHRPQQALNAYQQSLVCPGSVSQPRNGQVGAQFAIYDQQEHTLSFHTVPYNLEATISAMKKQSFPESLINRLRTGT